MVDMAVFLYLFQLRLATASDGTASQRNQGIIYDIEFQDGEPRGFGQVEFVQKIHHVGVFGLAVDFGHDG
jgi:hypothetical protein